MVRARLPPNSNIAKMVDDADGPDTSSIKPISSLRSRFENLGKQDAAVTSHTGELRQTSLTPGGPTARPRTSGGESNSYDATEGNLKDSGGSSPQTKPFAPATQRLKPHAALTRPTSMVSPTSVQEPRSPLLVTVDSPGTPRSPRKNISLDLRAPVSGNSTPLLPLTPDRTGNSSTNHSRNISRSATPAIEARAAALFQSRTADEATEKHVFKLPSPQFEAKPESKGKDLPKEAPVVNRAAKPKVPAKPQVLARNATNLNTPDVSGELSDRSASPFTTPPGSETGSPEPKKDSAVPGAQRPKKDSDASTRSVQPGRSRVESDASWVQRLRGDSDASIAERARAGSNASFVESSSLPDNWLPPPSHQAVAAMRQQHDNNSARAPSMPARYRPRPFQDSNLAQEDVEDAPRLPARPELQMRPGRTSPPKARSGRTSPLKSHMLPPRKSVDGLKRAATIEAESTPRIPAVKVATTKSALSQGFARDSSPPQSAPAVTAPVLPAPAVPPPRRSMDRRPPPQHLPASAPISDNPVVGNGHSRDDEEDPAPYGLNSDQVAGPADFPDATKTNRRPPKFKQRPWYIPTGYDTKLFAVCGEIVCTTGYITKAWNIRTGEDLLHMENRENVKVTSIVFKPSPRIEEEGTRVWLGTNTGDIHEVDIPSQSIAKTKPSAHARREVIRMFRFASELWTLDDGGELYIWRPDKTGMPSLDSQYNNWRVPRGHTFSIATGKQLWYATGKEIRVFLPSALSDVEFQAVRSPLSQAGTGDITSGATINGKPDLVYFGHSDGKVTVYNRRDFSCQAVVNVSVYRIASLAGVGDYLWAGYSTGMAYVYDTGTNPWIVKKDWKAHEKQICSIVADPSAMWKMGRLNVITLGLDNALRIWDGMLADDWLESRMHSRDSEYCSFQEMSVSVMTWNAGASKPSWLNNSREDSNFFRDYMTAREPPDIFVFGFQELVDLEDKKMTAKSFFKSKKKDKDPTDQEHMSHQYRAWRDHLAKCIDDYMPNSQTYTLVHTTSMVGLFTCVFVKSSIRPRINHVHTGEVKRGMGGHHGNKGALILRMIINDSSICFVNCHLAAGQTQTMHRNNDIAEILEATTLSPYPLNDGEGAQHEDVFAAGGDGSMIMDHEICILNGDLNYRIDTMGRDAVIKQVQQGNLGKLLERDQLLLSRKKNPGFRLRAFNESPITFAPTYKYNVNSDDYDTSEKKRAPAWCDRILYRGIGKVKMEEYRRWDQIRISDHRPVSGRLRLRVKSVDPDKREIIRNKCAKEFDAVRQRITRAAQ